MAILKDKSKKKKGENIIGKIIYGFLLFAPLLSILTTSLYVVFNKNAYQSYYGETINNKEYEKIDNITTYTGFMVYDVDTSIPYSTTVGSNIFEIENFKAEITGINNEEVTKLYMYSAVYQTDYNMWLSLRDTENNVLKNINLAIDSIYFTCYINDYSKTTNNTILANFENYFFTFKYNKYSYLDNAFDYGMYKTEQNNIYNWAKNTGTYTVLQTTTNQIGITNTFVPMLMAYWLLISIIYFIFDIALILIWAVHDKIHELKDAI